MASGLKVDVSIMPDFPTPPPHSDASSMTSSSSSTSSPSSSSEARSTVAGRVCIEAPSPPSPPSSGSSAPSSSSSSCPFGPDYDQNGQKIKRPMNAFMVWAQMRRAEITAVSSKVHNSTISKALGVEWREMSEAAKQPYVQKAKELRDELFREHPHYVYRPRKRKAAARPAPYSPRPAHHGGGTAYMTASMPSATATSLMLASATPSTTTPSSPAAASTTEQHLQQLLQLQQPAAPSTAQQMPMHLAPGLLQQLTQSAALAAFLQQQQQQHDSAAAAAAGIMQQNPLLFANLLNPLFAQMLTQIVASSSSL